MAPAVAVIGAQWGDEAKGKIVHFLSRKADFCVRFNGGPNAGHTVVDQYGEARLHQIPAGALHPQCVGVLAHGMVLDLWALREELAGLKTQGRPEPKIFISQRIHLILPYHRLREEKEGMADKLGTTRKGVGPAYIDRVGRRGLRLLDLWDEGNLRERICSEEQHLEDVEKVIGDLLSFRQELEKCVGDVQALLSEALSTGKRVVFEGAQGTMLDVDFGTYPYVTSSTTTVHGIPVGTGVWPDFSAVVGVTKAYATRVGAGPFPTEDRTSLGEKLREAGQEYGATTGRPRRCGWLDLVALRYAQKVNGFTHLALTKLDVLSGFSGIRVAVAYRVGGRRTEEFPAAPWELAQAEPVYEVLPGWKREIRGARDFEDLPKEAKEYVRFVEEAISVPVALIGTGREAEALVVSWEPWS